MAMRSMLQVYRKISRMRLRKMGEGETLVIEMLPHLKLSKQQYVIEPKDYQRNFKYFIHIFQFIPQLRLFHIFKLLAILVETFDPFLSILLNLHAKLFTMFIIHDAHYYAHIFEQQIIHRIRSTF